MNLLRTYFEALGGSAEVAKLMGEREMTAYTWMYRGVLPRDKIVPFIKLAKRHKVAVDIEYLITGEQK